MFKTIFTFLCLCLAATQASADTVIPAKYQIQNPNLHGGYCAYASAETAALAGGYPAAGGMLHERTTQKQWICSNSQCSWQYSGAATADMSDVNRKLRSRGVTTIYSTNYNYSGLTYNVNHGHPTIVSYRVNDKAGHAVVARSITPQTVYYYDPNYPGQTRSMSANNFQSRWHGTYISVVPSNQVKHIRRR